MIRTKFLGHGSHTPKGWHCGFGVSFCLRDILSVFLWSDTGCRVSRRRLLSFNCAVAKVEGISCNRSNTLKSPSEILIKSLAQ